MADPKMELNPVTVGFIDTGPTVSQRVPVTAANPLPVTTTGGTSQVTYTDKSGTVTSGGSAQTLMAANTSRRGFLVQNQSTGDLWISSLGAAAATQPSIWLPAGAYYEPPPTGVPTAAISIFGATTAQAFAAREW